MKPYVLFVGCNIPVRVPAYAASARLVLKHLGVSLLDLDAFGCCGYPVRNASQEAWLMAGAGNLALAEQKRLDLLVLCKCCFGSLKATQHLLANDHETKSRINRHLKKLGLEYQGTGEVRHLLTLLHQDMGFLRLADRIKTPFKKLETAVHYGCHALRPSRITQFDDPVNPKLFDELVGLTGAEPITWPSRLECCGAPLLGTNDALAALLKARKITDARKGGAAIICTACPWCQIQFNNHCAAEDRTADAALPGILYTQLLGLALGLDPEGLMLGTTEKRVLE